MAVAAKERAQGTMGEHLMVLEGGGDGGSDGGGEGEKQETREVT